ncbi:hypothetical protein B296_00013203, partial [Ensete ventricosum]
VVFVIDIKVILLKPLAIVQRNTHYDIPFPVLAHTTFSVRDTHIILHALVAYGWFDIGT